MTVSPDDPCRDLDVNNFPTIDGAFISRNKYNKI